jgi:hypothetical protein
MRACKIDCKHREGVADYRLERLRQLHLADVASCGYATERIEYLHEHPLITFRDWLTAHRSPS